MIKYNTPQELFTAICNSIRNKTNNNEPINHQDIPNKIDKIHKDLNILDTDTIEKYNSLLLLISDNITILDNDTIKKLNISFYENNNLTTVNLPECTSIGERVFEGCTNLTTVNLPKCTSIGAYAFGSREYPGYYSTTWARVPIANINLPECTSIGNYAFYMCSNLTTVILSGAQVVTLGKNVFDNTPITGIYNKPAGYIYVPDNLVSSYKTATNWSTYADKIKPISELPAENNQ